MTRIGRRLLAAMLVAMPMVAISVVAETIEPDRPSLQASGLLLNACLQPEVTLTATASS